MKFDWEFYFGLAEELMEQGKQEAGQKRVALLRTAISRAYYAVFGKASMWLSENYPTHLVPEHAEAHQSVSDFFLWSSNPEYQDIGRIIRRLRQRRNDADYNSTLGGLDRLAQATIFDANHVLNALGGLEVE